MAEWFYIGHYGQLGPLTSEQMDELVEGGVILPDTYVWCAGMPQWQTADTVPELRKSLQSAISFSPPPPPSFQQQKPTPAPSQPQPYLQAPAYVASNFYGRDLSTVAMRSDRSRTLAGILQILIPGVGRMYLGYYAYGLLQLVIALCTFFILHLWSVIDGIIILSGGVKYDGFGRVLGD